MYTAIRTISDPMSSKSKVKFFGDFKKELGKTLLDIEAELTPRIEEKCILDDIHVGANDIRVRVRHEFPYVEQIISVVFRFHHDDEKYGNVHIEIIISEVSEKKKSQFLGKYLVTNRKKIVHDVTKVVLGALSSIS